MDNTPEIQALLEQCKSLGADAGTMQTMVQSLYGDSTTPLGLNQWKSTDKPTMADFNRDNEIIDREVRALREESSIKANKSYVDDNFVLGYTQVSTGSIKDLINRPSAKYFITSTVTDLPESGLYWFAETICEGNGGVGMIEVTHSSQSRRYFQVYSNNIWRGWKQMTTV